MDNRFREHVLLRHKGFTLTEVAIVLGVVGLVLGGIWIAAANVYGNWKLNKALRDFTALSGALENVCTSLDTTLSQSDIIGNGYYYAGAMNGTIVAMGLVPTDMVNPTTKAIINPWNETIGGYPNSVIITIGTYVPSAGFSIPAGATGNFGAPIPPAGSAVNAYEILFNAITTDGCVHLATSLTGPQRDPNIVTVFINNWSAGAGYQTFPLTPSQAAAACSASSNNMAGPNSNGVGNVLDGTSSIDVVYKYR